MKLTKLFFAAVLAISAVAAQATPITGELSLTGDATLDSPADTATSISFGTVVVNAAASDGFAAGNGGTMVTMNGFQFDPVLAPAPVNPLWTFLSAGGPFAGSTFSFVLEAITAVNRVTIDSITVLNVLGAGTISSDATGLDPTFAEFSLTTQGGQNTTVTFSSLTIPEPSTLAALGLGLLGLGFAARRRSVRS